VRRATESLRDDARPRTAIVEWTEPMMLAGNWTPELLSLGGGTCPLAIAGRHSAYVAWEQVRAFDPEMIVVAPCGFDLARSMKEAAGLALLPGWQDVAAVRNRRVVVVDGNAYFNRSGPRLVESLEMLGHLLHPERVPRPGWVKAGSEPWRVA
jgi:iron complex transport system substrate-binding protein